MSFQKMDLSNRKRPGGRNLVMVYGYSGFDMEKIAATHLNSGVDEWLYIDDTRSEMVINDLIKNVKDNQDIKFSPHKDKVILFNGTSQFELQQFLNQAMTITKDRPLVAMVTPTSKDWTFSALIKELKLERREMDKNR